MLCEVYPRARVLAAALVRELLFVTHLRQNVHSWGQPNSRAAGLSESSEPALLFFRNRVGSGSAMAEFGLGDYLNENMLS